MAKRLNPRHQEMVRAKIQTSVLIDLLQKDAMGVKRMAPGSRRSAEFLVNKSLSNPPEDTNLNLSGGTDITVRGV